VAGLFTQQGELILQLGENLFSGAWWWVITVSYILALGLAFRLAPWRWLRVSEQLHVFLGASVALILLWSIKAEVNPGLSFHLLGVTSLTLMFGWSLGVISATMALLGISLNAGVSWDSFALNGLLLGVVPATITQVLLVVVRSLLPKNFFIFVLVNGFLTAGFVMLLTGYLAVGLLTLSGFYNLQDLEESFMPFFPLMSMPEAFLNGWVMTVLVAYRPNWVYSFSDELYLKGK
jgi:uncharacterized membrane protein